MKKFLSCCIHFYLATLNELSICFVIPLKVLSMSQSNHCSNQPNAFPYQVGSFLLPSEEKRNSENAILSADDATLDTLCRHIYISLPSTWARFIFQGFSLTLNGICLTYSAFSKYILCVLCVRLFAPW